MACSAVGAPPVSPVYVNLARLVARSGACGYASTRFVERTCHRLPACYNFRMRRRLCWLIGLMCGVMLLLDASRVNASSDISALAARLRTSDDFRIRTQAALALGASADARAVRPLCGGLADRATTVRAAAAAALGRLNKGGKQCLAKRLQAEDNAEVRAVIERALEKMGARTPKIGPDTRVYVAIGDVTSKASQSNRPLQDLVRRLLVKHFAKAPGVVVAPAGETAEQATKLLKQYPAVKAVYIWPKVTVQYAGKTLQIKVDVTLFSYPDKSMLGMLSRKLSVGDTQPGDTDTEDELLDMAANQLVPDVQKYAGRS